jgi:hypothetical protein
MDEGAANGGSCGGCRAAPGAAVFESAVLLDARDDIQRAREDGAERGLRVEGRIGGRDDADAAAPQFADKAGEVSRRAGQVVYVADDQYVDLSGVSRLQHLL